MLEWLAVACLLIQDPLSELDSADPALARRAFEAAIRKGDEKALEEAAKTSERARLALAEVRAHKRFGDAYPAVRTFSLNLKDRPYAAALEELARTLGVKADRPGKLPGGMKDPTADPVTIDLRDVYLLEAVERFAAETKTYLWLTGGELKMSPFSIPGSPKTAWRNFLLWPDSLVEERTSTPFGVTKSTYLEARFLVDGSPRLVGIRAIRLRHATDDLGDDAALANQSATWPVHDFMPGSQYTIRLALKELSPKAKKLSSVRGEIEFLLPQEPYFVDVPLKGDHRETAAEGVKVRVDPDGGLVLLTCTVLDPAKLHVRPRPADFRLLSSDEKIEEGVFTSAGPPHAPVQSWKIAPPEGFEPAFVRVRFFKSTGGLSVPFEFTDIPVR